MGAKPFLVAKIAQTDVRPIIPVKYADLIFYLNDAYLSANHTDVAELLGQTGGCASATL
jgi:hypothetical protein